MAKLERLIIKHFRGIENFEQRFKGGITCIIGRGDSGKSTILDAISYVFSQSWGVHLNDSDFYKCDTNTPIIIEGVVSAVPEEMLQKYDNHLRGIKSDGTLVDDMESDDAVDADPVLTIRLTIKKDLEPSWDVVSYNGVEPTTIKTNDRSKLNVFTVSDYADRHFSMSKGNPLYSLYKQLDEDAQQNNGNAVLDIVREAKSAFDRSVSDKFTAVISKIETKAKELGITLNEVKAMLDQRDIAINENKVSIHEDGVPFRLKGKGSKRLLSLAIQLALSEPSGVILIDEIEQGLEPYRARHLVATLSKYTDRQIILTTHSSHVIVEIPCEALYIMRESARSLKHVEGDVQGCVRNNPDAFFGRKVLVCEGPTEIGLARAFDGYRTANGKESYACCGICAIDGHGKNLENYVKGFKSLDYETALLCDSDDDTLKKKELIDAGAMVFDWDEGLALEQQLFYDVSWEVVKEFLSLYYTNCEKEGASQDEAKKRVFSQVVSILGRKETYNEHWLDQEKDELRKALGKAAKQGKGWYKTIGKGEALGAILFSHFLELDETKSTIRKKLDELSNWIDS